MVMRSAQFDSIFCLFALRFPSVALGQQHMHVGTLTDTQVRTVTLSWTMWVNFLSRESRDGCQGKIKGAKAKDGGEEVRTRKGKYSHAHSHSR